MARVRRGISWSIALATLTVGNAQVPVVREGDGAVAESESRVRWVLPEEYAAPRLAADGDRLVYTAPEYRRTRERYRPYEGPTMREGYGRGYDSLGFRYGLEEALHERYYTYLERRYSDYGYPSYRPQPYGRHRTRRGRRYDVDLYRHDVTARDRDRGETSRRLHLKDMNRRAERLLSSHERKLREGLELLRSGQADRAVVALTVASKLNQGDPASRIHLSQARLALGHYREAAAVLRRALELQPKLVYEELNLDRYYARRGMLERYTATLGEAVESDGARADLQFLLGFYSFQLGDFERAHRAFGKAADARPGDELIRSYLSITRPAESRR